MPDNRTKKNRPERAYKILAMKLQERTGLDFMACKLALVWAHGDMDKATEYLNAPMIDSPVSESQ